MTSNITEIKGTIMPMLMSDIDTDRIIPARFLRCVTFDALGSQAFYDERFDSNGNKLAHPMNEERFQGANIILSGNNFGCGSSREHAPQSIKRAGYKAIIAESFAEIFYSNSSVLGLVCITMDKDNLSKLNEQILSKPDTAITIDIEKAELTAGDKKYKFTIKETLQKSLLAGTYDTIYELLKNKEKADEMASNLPPKKYS